MGVTLAIFCVVALVALAVWAMIRSSAKREKASAVRLAGTYNRDLYHVRPPNNTFMQGGTVVEIPPGTYTGEQLQETILKLCEKRT